MRHALFLDTMTYLHYLSVEQIDWQGVLGVSKADEVLIVVPGITLREIDKHKNHTPRLRERAQKVGTRIAAWIAEGRPAIRPGVHVVSAPRVPNIDFEAEGFDRTSNDDVLVAAALDYQRNNPGITVVIVTQDAYPRVIAQGHGLVVHSLSDDLKLPAEEDATENENRELRRRIQQLEAARPDLRVEFASVSKQSREFVIPTMHQLSEKDLAEAIQAMERQHPPADSFRVPSVQVPPTAAPSSQDAGVPLTGIAAAMLSAARAQEMQRLFLGSIDAEDLKRYAAERSSFLADYEEYLRERREFEMARARRFMLELELVNTGSVPATDVDVHLHVPDGVVVSGEYDLTEPQAPEPPTRPRRSAEILFQGLSSHSYPSIGSFRGPDTSYLESLVARGPRQRNVSDLDIEETGSYTIRCHVGRIKHGLREALPSIYVTIPEDAPVRPFQITYSLHAANLPEAASGTLNVLLKSDPEDTGGAQR